jgi:hypothetical protein
MAQIDLQYFICFAIQSTVQVKKSTFGIILNAFTFGLKIEK